MTFRQILRLSFMEDFSGLAESDRHKVVRALAQIEESPHGKNVKKILKDFYRNLYRYRVGNLRICYAVGTSCVALVAVGHRDEIYARLERGALNTTVDRVPEDDAELVRELPAFRTLPSDPLPSHTPDGADEGCVVPAEPGDESRGLSLDDLLDLWGASAAERELVSSCRSLDAVLDLDLREDLKAHILHVQSAPHIRAIEEQPSYELPPLAALEEQPELHLSSLLLALDDEQAAAASAETRGPLLVRGGPGTGKSVVSLYRVRRLYEPRAQQELFGSQPPRTLVVTYTKALSRLSEQLLEKLLGPDLRTNVVVKNMDAVAREFAGAYAQEQFKERSKAAALEREVESARQALLAVLPGDTPGRKTLELLPAEYLLDEFDWVIDGRSLVAVEEYLSCNRAGRGTRLDGNARRLVWQLYNTWREALVESGVATFPQVQCEALRRAAELPVSEKYDVVVLDEAQDLKPVGIRLALALCKTPQGLYMTADENQSIYGRGYSWRQVSDDLRLQGRSIVLRRNYRTTREIQDAALAFLRVGGIEDPETKAIPVHSGPRPILALCSGDSSGVIAELFQAWSRELALPLHMGAVLTPTHRQAEEIAHGLGELGAGIKARACRSGDINVDERVVKCMTIHTAKGLEFPFVALAGLTAETIPRREYVAVDEDDLAQHLQQERKLLHVGMTRAMKRLVACVPAADPSPLLADLDTALWDVRHK